MGNVRIILRSQGVCFWLLSFQNVGCKIGFISVWGHNLNVQYIENECVTKRMHKKVNKIVKKWAKCGYTAVYGTNPKAERLPTCKATGREVARCRACVGDGGQVGNRRVREMNDVHARTEAEEIGAFAAAAMRRLSQTPTPPRYCAEIIVDKSTCVYVCCFTSL